MLHKHNWTWQGQGYVNWVPEMGRSKQWITIYLCKRCDQYRCQIREVLTSRYE